MPSQKRPTMQEIADQLGLSRVTVSSVINGNAIKRGISQKTIDEVNTFLSKNGYVPSLQAKNLRSGNRNSLGILYSGTLYSHLTEAFNQIVALQNSQEEPLEIMICQIGQVINAIKELRGRGVTKLIWIQKSEAEQEIPHLEELINYLSPLDSVVFYNYKFGGGYDEKLAKAGVHLVGINRYQAFLTLGKFLKNNGHKNVFLSGNVSNANELNIQKALEEQTLKVYTPSYPTKRLTLIKEGEFFGAEIMKIMNTHQITAACFLDDEVAGHAMSFLHDKIKIPEELTVTGFDGMSFSSALVKPLTTLQIPIQEMVHKVFLLLNEKRFKQNNYHHEFSMKLVKRMSHGKAKKVSIW